MKSYIETAIFSFLHMLSFLPGGHNLHPAPSFNSEKFAHSVECGKLSDAEIKAHLHHIDKNGMTPLMAAASSNRIKAVKHLLRLGAHRHFDALIFACRSCHLEVVKELLKSPDLNINQTSNGMSPLGHAIYGVNLPIPHNCDLRLTHSREDGLKIVELLLKAGADPNGDEYDSPLATAFACLGYTQLLAQMECDEDDDDEYDEKSGLKRYLSSLASYFNINKYKFRIKAQAKAKKEYYTKLIKAMCDNSTKMTLMLLSHKADVNKALDRYNHSILMLAAICGTPEHVQLLVQAGADVSRKTTYGKTVIDILQNKTFNILRPPAVTEEIANFLKQASDRKIKCD